MKKKKRQFYFRNMNIPRVLHEGPAIYKDVHCCLFFYRYFAGKCRDVAVMCQKN